MSYMDQGMDCKLCGKEHSQFSTGVCLDCESKEREAKLKAEWDSKTPIQKAIHYLEKWADPQAMTFSKHDAKFVLAVVKSLAAPAPRAEADQGEQVEIKKLTGGQTAQGGIIATTATTDGSPAINTASSWTEVYQQGRAAGLEEAVKVCKDLLQYPDHEAGVDGSLHEAIEGILALNKQEPTA